MANICAKLKQRNNKNKYRKIVSTDKYIYSNDIIKITSLTSTKYIAGAALEDGEWFFIENMSKQEYSIDLIKENYNSIDFDSISKSEFENIDFIFIKIDDLICFQNIYKTKLVSKKCVLFLGEDFEYQNERKEIVINDIPDAIYDKTMDVLYFKRLESITKIFKGIDQLYKEATEEETKQFLKNDFIILKNSYNASKVKTANRKRIALAQKTLSKLNNEDINNIFTYIGEYCPKLKVKETAFEIGTEDDLKLLLYGIEQRFYTTTVGCERRIANSVVPLVV